MKKRGKKEGKKKTKKAASQGKQINSSVGWSRVFSGLAPNICFARPPIPAEEYTSTAYLQKSRELPTKLPPPTHPISIDIPVCVCHPLSFRRNGGRCRAKNTLATRPSRLLLQRAYIHRDTSVETNTRFSDGDECHFFK